MDIRTVMLHLSLIEGIGPAVIQRLLATLGESALIDLYALSVSELMERSGLSLKTADQLVNGLADQSVLVQELALIVRHKVRWVTLMDAAYPPLLKDIHLPPAVLYWWGADFTVADQSVAFVGSRAATAYGHRVITSLVAPLVQAGFAIVSGGAFGADTMAHRAAIEAKGITVVVLGAGLLQPPYPSSNKRLFEEVVASGGIVLSCFPLAMEALPGNFPARNRIIAGLSRSCVVVQAAAKSGALITAEYALQQGREVCAVPGAFDDPLSAGCHALIKQGAQLVTSADHIMRELGYATPISSDKKEKAASQPPSTHPVEQQMSILVKNDAHPQHAALLHACRQSPCSLDELVLLLHLDSVTVQDMLFDMQMSGDIEQEFTGKWVVR
jgi:DNA processing protein